MAIIIQKNPWKVNQTLNGFGPICSLVSVYDLIFDANDDSASYDGYRISPTGVLSSGMSMDHDIICYNSSVYQTNGEVIKTSLDNFLNYGIDICPAKFDPSAKTAKKTISFTHPLSNLPINEVMTFSDKASALYPTSTITFEGSRWNTLDLTSTSDLTYSPVSLGIGGSGSSATTTFQISETDPVFNATIKQDGLTSYTKIALGTNNFKTWQIIGHFIPDILTRVEALATYESLRELLHFYKDALKHCYVWIKLRYFADYINQDEFEQDLNPNSDVKHKNIIVSATGDYNRYDGRLNSTEESKPTSHRPYIPKTVPSLDLLSDKIYEGYDYNNDLDRESTLSNVISQTTFTDSDSTSIGQLQTTPVNQVFTENEGTVNEETDHQKDSLTHPGYFDPESRMVPAEYDHKPVLLSKDGNLITDGRILSPTVDELWVYIKRLVDGRLNDDTALSSDSGVPRSTTANRKITEDLLPVAPKNFKIYDKNDVERLGDPLDTTIMDTGSGITREKLVISSYINAPEGLSLSQYDQLLRISEAIIGTTGKNTKNISNFAPWQTNPSSYEDIRDSNPVQPDMLNTGTLQSSQLWGPRSQPLSLREVEALLKQAKLNMISLARFMKENFSITGGLGRELNITDESKKARGAMYQFHKDYNFKVDDPNTVFGGVNGNVELPLNETRDVEGLIVGKSKSLDNNYYGQSSEIPNEPNSFGSSEVYLAADGTWRTLWSHVRVPIVSEEY